MLSRVFAILFFIAAFIFALVGLFSPGRSDAFLIALVFLMAACALGVWRIAVLVEEIHKHVSLADYPAALRTTQNK